jgi:peptidoglycan hydrolase-like protein with peptidoglycan-binding domain
LGHREDKEAEMTPRQARVALGVFVLLATGVTGNALYLQGASTGDGAARRGDAAKQRSPSARADAPKRANLVKARPAEAKLKAPPDEADVEAVRGILRELERRGYGPIVADGMMRPAARAAIMAFEHEHRLPLTGEATQTLMKHLVFGVPSAARAPGEPQVRSLHAEALVKDVQRLLAHRGYRSGAIDGRLGAETVRAIRAFEADQGLEPEGRISARLVVRLQDDGSGGRRPRAR